MSYSMDYLKAKAEEVWNAYENFKEDLCNLQEKAEAAGIENADKLDFLDTFSDLNYELGTALEDLFGISCLEE